ncbi:hypothetical protein [Anabaena sp. CCY 9402-a]|uniref:hypothetical protein n=1 Tax=Anabaena sp. CCY 9402-a TaxID=3103867 RepID=UPI0039C6ECB8
MVAVLVTDFFGWGLTRRGRGAGRKGELGIGTGGIEEGYSGELNLLKSTELVLGLETT